jgi:uncharacterized RDD family membrane protein YckC
MVLENNALISAPTEPVFTFPPVASFWRRLAAWIVDILLLGIIGQILGWSLSIVLFQFGPYGRIIGIFFILPYFGLMNSRIGKGQTIGKRLLKIAVRDSDNKHISLVRSLIRISILEIPILFNGWALPIFHIPVVQWLLTIIIFGLGTAIFYTMVFNSKTRQGIHDLLCKTIVVHLPGKPIEKFPQSAKIHWIISGVLVALSALMPIGGRFISSAIISRTSLTQVNSLYQILQSDKRFFSASVNIGTLHSSQGKITHMLQIQVWYKGVPSNDERTNLLNDIAKIALANAENIDQYDLLRITVTSSYDLGIASGNISYGDGEPIQVWRQRTGNIQSP